MLAEVAETGSMDHTKAWSMSHERVVRGPRVPFDVTDLVNEPRAETKAVLGSSTRFGTPAALTFKAGRNRYPAPSP